MGGGGGGAMLSSTKFSGSDRDDNESNLFWVLIEVEVSNVSDIPSTIGTIEWHLS